MPGGQGGQELGAGVGERTQLGGKATRGQTHEPGRLPW